jgi:hypothetical protein
MSPVTIQRIVFYAPHVLIDESGEPLPLMPELVGEIAGRVECAAVCPDQRCAQAVSRRYGEAIVETAAVGRQEGYAGELQSLLERAVLDTVSTLFVDRSPTRCLRAIDLGIYTGIFVDAPRLYRDLGAWRIIPLEPSLKTIQARLAAVSA